MDWYLQVLKKYAEFKGRARREEYWFFILFNMIFAVILMIIDFQIGTFNEDLSLGMLSGVYLAAVSIPCVAVTVRRLHDTDRAGWWFLITFVPYIGGIFLLVLTVLDSTPGENKYGSNPKVITEVTE